MGFRALPKQIWPTLTGEQGDHLAAPQHAAKRWKSLRVWGTDVYWREHWKAPLSGPGSRTL